MHTNISVLHQRLPNTWRWLIALLAVLAVTLGLAVTAHAAQPAQAVCTGTGTVADPLHCELWARASAAPFTLPGGGSVTVWGYTDNAGGVITMPGGPTLVATEGYTVEIVLHNDLPGEMTSLALHGQGLGADRVGIASGSSTMYTFTASRPGTYLYEAGMTPNGVRQVAMGLYGALIVQPATSATTYDSEAVLVLSEIDPALNAAPTTFDMTEYKPSYWLINGQAYPGTDPISAPSGNTVRLRYVNAGLNENSMGLLGLDQEVIAADGYVLSSYRVVAETIPPGGTLDTLVAIPATAAEDTQYALYSTAQHLDNNGAAYGGQLMYLTVGAPPPVVVTVSNTTGAPQSGLNVYAFSGAIYTGMSGTTDVNGEVSFTLASGSYNFRADKNGTQFFSGGASGVNTCTVPGCTTDSVTVTDPVVVTVSDTNSVAQSGLNVYAFSGVTYTGLSGVTDGSGQVSFTLVPGDYNFRADKNGTQFFSGGASGVNTCSIPSVGVNCTTDSVTVTDPVVVTVSDTNSVAQSGLNVYAFSGATFTGLSGTTDGSGQVSFTLVPGDYNFRADKNGTQFFSGGASGINTCSIPSVGLDCTTDSVTVTDPVMVTVSNTNSVAQSGLNVYAFSGVTYTGQSGVTDVNGEVSFTLVPGDYNFRADKNGTQFFSGGASGVNTCTVPSVGVTCTTDSVTVTDPVVVTVLDTISAPQSGLNVYAFSGVTYTGQSGVTDGSGQVSFTLVPGDYNFRADVGSSQYFSGGASGVNTCTVLSVGLDCTTDTITIP